jgi:hypothetical protein
VDRIIIEGVIEAHGTRIRGVNRKEPHHRLLGLVVPHDRDHDIASTSHHQRGCLRRGDSHHICFIRHRALFISTEPPAAVCDTNESVVKIPVTFDDTDAPAFLDRCVAIVGPELWIKQHRSLEERMGANRLQVPSSRIATRSN